MTPGNVALQLAFKNWDIWPIVNRTKPCPDQMTNPTSYSEWGFKDCEARLIMITVLKKVGQKCIFCMISAKEYWDQIATCYSGTGSSNKCTISVLQQFFKASFTDTELLQPQINKVFFFFLNSCLLSLTGRLPDMYYLLCAYHCVPYKLNYSVYYCRIKFRATSTPLPTTAA